MPLSCWGGCACRARLEQGCLMLECTVGIHSKGWLVLYRSCTDTPNRWFLGCTRRALRRRKLCRCARPDAPFQRSSNAPLQIPYSPFIHSTLFYTGSSSSPHLLGRMAHVNIRTQTSPSRRTRPDLLSQIRCLDRACRSNRLDRLGRVPPRVHLLTGTTTGTP